MTRFIIFALLILSLNGYAQNPVILLSIDGFSHKYLAQYKPKNLLSLANQGIMADGMTPVFPSKTFPNHLSIVTGMYPAKHGIVHNKFYNKKLHKQYSLGAGKNNSAWLTANPIWAVAEEKGFKSAIYFWPESEAMVNGVLPSHYFPYKHNEPNINRINQIINWLKLPSIERPNFIAGYFSTIDDAGHRFGPNSKEVAEAILNIDTLIGTLIKRIKSETTATPNIIIVSDHGMTPIDKTLVINWKSLLSNYSKLNVINGQTQLYIYEEDKKVLNDVRSHLSNVSSKHQFEIMDKSNYPDHWHFNVNNAVVPDMVINALPPTIFVSEKSHIGSATHGYDAKYNSDLSAIFIAHGPDLKNKVIINSFESIHVFSLIESLLGLPLSTDVDSDINVLSNITNRH
ncbi:MAG: ectonucleotide pyrophosphatase/phosphodiesterase [Thalassotalea sp.]|nr:ectonucleotide pyrophosphatase/phosphodiesterase [Thalassotalea sp.]